MSDIDVLMDFGLSKKEAKKLSKKIKQLAKDLASVSGMTVDEAVAYLKGKSSI